MSNEIAPYPWSVERTVDLSPLAALRGDTAYVYIKDANGKRLTWTMPHAHLMAAAPELLVALKESIALNDTLDPRTEARYKEIIAKAEGKNV